MKRLLEAVNNGILKGLSDSDIELLSDLDDGDLDQLDQIQTKNINTAINVQDITIKNQLIQAIQTGNISIKLKRIINNRRNFNRFKGIIGAKNLDHLRKLVSIGITLLGVNGNFNWIDTSEITDMHYLFFCMGNFNGHIELWDVSNVTNMKGMFWDATSFNQNISNWDVSNVTNMCRMFYIAESFNQDISEWDVRNVKYNKEIFNDCHINDEFKPKFNGE